MTGERSEALFVEYLEREGLQYERDYYIGPGNVDFRVHMGPLVVFSDVKEVRDSAKGVAGNIDAETHIRSDLRKLRRKFGAHAPQIPCLLVTMNFSRKFFTGLTVARAMHGEIGLTYDLVTRNRISELHHLPRANASSTKKQNTGISGIFVFDWRHADHWIFGNPFARYPVPTASFPKTKYMMVERSVGPHLVDLSRLMFFGRN
jgi:hypothetical protein